MRGNIAISDAIDPGEIQEFVIDLAPWVVHRFSLQALSGSGGDTLVASVATEAGVTLATVRSAGDQPALHDRQTLLNAFRVGDPRTLRVTVRGARASDSGPFTMLMRAPGNDAERGPSHFTIGELVGTEWIDGLDDIDQFSFHATAGQEFLVQVGTPVAVPGYALGVKLLNPNGTTLYSTGLIPEVRVTEEWARRLTFTWTGEHILEFFEAGPTGGINNIGWVAPYDFRITPVFRTPESVAERLVLSDSITESIDHVGDIDEFIIGTAAGEEFVLNVRAQQPFDPPLEFELWEGENRQQFFETATAQSDLNELGTTRILATALDQYRLHVFSGVSGRPADASGAYQVEMYRVDRAPESIPAVHPFGVLVSGESIDRRGDIDEFPVEIDSGTIFAVRYGTTLPTAGSQLELELILPTGESFGGASFGGATGPLAAWGARVVAGADETFTVRAGSLSPDPLPYEFQFSQIDPLPELIAAEVPIGPWIAGEAISPLPDIDRFTFAADSGDILNVQLEPVGPPAFLWMQASVGAGAYIFGLAPNATGWLNVPATGEYGLEVGANLVTADSAPYRFRILRIDPRPESVDSLIAYGDTISGEAIDVPGDIDHFVFDATAGERIEIRIVSPSPDDLLLHYALYQPDGSLMNAGQGDDVLTTFLPSTGRYRLRIIPANPARTDLVGAYSFSLLLVP